MNKRKSDIPACVLQEVPTKCKACGIDLDEKLVVKQHRAGQTKKYCDEKCLAMDKRYPQMFGQWWNS